MQPEAIDTHELMRDRTKRRAFLQRMGVAGMGVAAVSLLNGCNGSNGDGGPNPQATATNSPNGTATPGGTAQATAQATATARPGIDQRNFPGIIGQNINQVVFNFVLGHEYGEVDLHRQALNIASGLPAVDHRAGRHQRLPGRRPVLRDQALHPGRLGDPGYGSTPHRDLRRHPQRRTGR